MKPKLVRIPYDQANHTEKGILIKINDKCFVLVEEVKSEVHQRGGIIGGKLAIGPAKNASNVYLKDHRTSSLPRWTVISRKFIGSWRNQVGPSNYIVEHVQAHSPQIALNQARMGNRPHTIEPLFVFFGTHNPVWEKGRPLNNMEYGNEIYFTLIMENNTKQKKTMTVKANSMTNAMYRRPVGYQVMLVFRGHPRIM